MSMCTVCKSVINMAAHTFPAFPALVHLYICNHSSFRTVFSHFLSMLTLCEVQRATNCIIACYFDRLYDPILSRAMR